MSNTFDDLLVNAVINVDGVPMVDITIKEITLGESLLTPGLQTAVTLQSFVYTQQRKNWMNLKNKTISINMSNRAPEPLGRSMDVRQKVYRIDNRELDINVGQTETLTIHACDQTLLNDAKTLVSKSWKCTRPSEIVDYILQSCAGASNPIVDSADPARDYIAENIHPFQVIAQQANVALDGDDPSFLHYMTYENGGTHYFRSLKKLMHQGIVGHYFHSEANMDLANPSKVINFSFPNDFDLLSDLLNGLDENGHNINTVSTFNPVNMAAQLLGLGSTGGMAAGGCGMGSGNHKTAITNKGTSKQQNSCDIDVEQWLLLRQARMAILERDRVTLRLTIPWEPNLHVGDSIGFVWMNKTTGAPVFGSSFYMISALKHNIQFGGYATTTLDCIARVL
jgi:hypothetical protein